jgi:hypothetical protein
MSPVSDVSSTVFWCFLSGNTLLYYLFFLLLPKDGYMSGRNVSEVIYIHIYICKSL